MSDTTEARLPALMEAAAARAAHEPTDLEGKIGAYYKAFMDSAAVEKLGTTPLAPHLAQVRTAATRDAIAALMGHSNRAFNGAIFSTYVDVDLKNPKIYGLPQPVGTRSSDRDYYLKPGFAAPRAAYQRYAATLLHLIDWPDADVRAKDSRIRDGDRRGELDEGTATRCQRRVQSDDSCRPQRVRIW